MMEPSRERTRTVQSETSPNASNIQNLQILSKNWAAPLKLRDHFVLTNKKYHPSDTLQQTNTCEKTNGFPKNILNKWCFVHACVSHLSENLPGGTSFHLKKTIYNPILVKYYVSICAILIIVAPYMTCIYYGCGFPPCLDHVPREKPIAFPMWNDSWYS